MVSFSRNRGLLLKMAIIFWTIPIISFAQNSPFKTPVELNDGKATNIIDIKHIDLDGDGMKDLVTASRIEIRWYKGKGNGEFEKSRTLEALAGIGPQNHIISFDVGDLDEDGDLDLLYGTRTYRYALFNDGTLNFQKFSVYVDDDRSLQLRLEILEDSTDSGDKVIECMPYDVRLTKYTPGSRTVIQTIQSNNTICIPENLDSEHEKDLVFANNSFVGFIFNPFSNKSSMGYQYDEPYYGDYRDFETVDLAVIDVNNDGFKDVVLSNKLTDSSYRQYSRDSYEGKLIYLENDSNKTFKEMVVIDEVDPGYSSIIATDIDGDSKEDLIALSATNSFKTGNIVSFINQGDGSFSEPEPLFEEQIFIDNMYQFDIDEDGLTDLIVSSQERDLFGWYKRLENGYGQFTEIERSFIPSPRDIKTMDVDRDGLEDLIVSTGNPNKALLWYRNIGNFEFEAGIAIENNQQFASTLEIGDLDGDGLDDVVMLVERQAKRYNTSDIYTGYSVIARDLYWYQNMGNSSFSEKKLIAQDTSSNGHLSIMDIDRDGDLDIQLISDRSSVLLLSDGNGNFTKSEIELPTGLSRTTGDINGDNFDELITVTAKDSVDQSNLLHRIFYEEYSIFSMDSSFSFHKSRGVGMVNELAAFDLNGDGSEEIIRSTQVNQTQPSPRIILEAISYNYNQQSMTNTTIDSSQTGFHSFTVNDFDNDGDLDIVSTEIATLLHKDSFYRGGTTNLYINEGHMNFTKTQQLDSLSLGNTDSNITHGINTISSEMNGDKFPEVISYSIDKEWVTLYPNTVGQQVSTESGPDVPQAISLSQNYPNPFNPSTMINYSIPTAEKVELKVYNLLGQLVQTLVNDRKTAGMHQVRFDASAFASGVYIYQLKAADKVQTKKMILIK